MVLACTALRQEQTWGSHQPITNRMHHEECTLMPICANTAGWEPLPAPTLAATDRSLALPASCRACNPRPASSPPSLLLPRPAPPQAPMQEGKCRRTTSPQGKLVLPLLTGPQTQSPNTQAHGKNTSCTSPPKDRLASTSPLPIAISSCLTGLHAPGIAAQSPRGRIYVRMHMRPASTRGASVLQDEPHQRGDWRMVSLGCDMTVHGGSIDAWCVTKSVSSVLRRCAGGRGGEGREEGGWRGPQHFDVWIIHHSTEQQRLSS